MCLRSGIIVALMSTAWAGNLPAQLPPEATAPAPVALQSFQGTASQTTPAFQAPDSWQVRWNGPRGLNIAVLAADETIVAGAAGTRGALYLPKGGMFHLQIDYQGVPQGTPGSTTPSPAPAPTPFENTLTGNSGSSGEKWSVQSGTPPSRECRPTMPRS